MNPDPYVNPGPSGGFVPFAPFRLDLNQEAGFELEVHVEGACIPRGGGFVSWHEEPVTYSIYGIRRHSFVDTGNEIRLEGTTSTTC